MQLLLNVHSDQRDYHYNLFAVVTITQELMARALARRSTFKQSHELHTDLMEMRFNETAAVYFKHHSELSSYCDRACVSSLGELLEDEIALLEETLEVPEAAIQLVELPQIAVYQEAIYFITRLAPNEPDAEVYTAVITFDLLQEMAGMQSAKN